VRQRWSFTASILIAFLLLIGVSPLLYRIYAEWVAEQELDREYSQLIRYRVKDIEALETWFVLQQNDFLGIVPPGSDPWLQTGSPRLIPFDAKRFPEAFNDGLIGEWVHGAPVYDVIIAEDPVTRERRFFNADGKEIYALNAPRRYDPRWFVLRAVPDLYEGGYSEEDIVDLLLLYDPSRVQIRGRLIPTEYLRDYLYAEQKHQSASTASLEPLELEMLLLGGRSGGNNDLWLSIRGPAAGLTNVEVTIRLPDGFTNRVEIYSFDATTNGAFDGIDSSPWLLAMTNDSTAGTNQLVWFDMNADSIQSRFYAAGNGDVDTDGDTLADAREMFLYHTQPGMADSDGDGATDGQEIDAGTNPNNDPGDTDGDGLSDDLEIVLGTSAVLPDSDFDWTSDGYEVEEGTDPDDDTDFPPYRFHLVSEPLFINTSQFLVTSPGMAADRIIIGENRELSPATTNLISSSVLYTMFSASNGQRYVFARWVDTTWGRTSVLAKTSFTLDTTQPQLSITNPAVSPFTTDRRWIPIQGIATDDVTAVSVWVQSNRAPGVANGRFWQSQYMLSNGTNRITVYVEDQTGNAATADVEVVQHTLTDTNPPSLAVFWPLDYEVNSGTTNWLDQVTVGNDDTFHVWGQTDDETAAVRAYVVHEETTNGPYEGLVLDTEFVIEAPVPAGTNTVMVLIDDAAGNTVTAMQTVVKNTNLFLSVSSPGAYQAVNGPSAVVSGTASTQFMGGAILVNGYPTTMQMAGNQLTFETTNAVPFNLGLTPLSIEGQLPGGGQVHQEHMGLGHIVFLTQDRAKFAWNDQTTHDGYFYVNYGQDNETHVWEVEETSHAEHLFEDSEACVAPADDPGDMDCSQTYTDVLTSTSSDTWPAGVSVRMGSDVLEMERGPHPANGMDQWANYEYTFEGALEIRNLHAGENGSVAILQFGDLDYSRASGDPLDPADIKLWGRPGFWYNGEVAFAIPVTASETYTLDATSFEFSAYTSESTVPESDETGGAGTIHQYEHVIEFSWVSNMVLNVEVTSEGEPVGDGGFVYIAGTPEMPDLQARLTGTNLPDQAKWRLKIEYKRAPRDDEEYYPSETTWKTLDAAATWGITADMGTDFRGGKATLFCVYKGVLFQPAFHIRGNNPTESAAKSYLDANGPWYTYCIAKHESGTQNGRTYLQFNEIGMPGPDPEDYRDCPNRHADAGGTYGWGMLMLTRFEVSAWGGWRSPGDGYPWAQELWNWKAQADTAITVLEATCKPYVENHLKTIAPDGMGDYIMPPDITISGVLFAAGTSKTPDQLGVIKRYNSNYFWTAYDPLNDVWTHVTLDSSEYTVKVLNEY
jgi:hypothetical protein